MAFYNSSMKMSCHPPLTPCNPTGPTKLLSIARDLRSLSASLETWEMSLPLVGPFKLRMWSSTESTHFQGTGDLTMPTNMNMKIVMRKVNI